ncbi:hypothetical protein CEXT_8711 [Caerostris extrusa]|uniref:Uncharacterized protein n=1 Tax=Caerostris extrusa TaxID=172846 RepID=A0AAV4PHS8_CAEEX|nr:hypothetical protein CEXT_8711 [Caerostris extrusa]
MDERIQRIRTEKKMRDLYEPESPPAMMPQHTHNSTPFPPLTRCHDSKNIPSHSLPKARRQQDAARDEIQYDIIDKLPAAPLSAMLVPLHCTHCEGWRGKENVSAVVGDTCECGLDLAWKVFTLRYYFVE